MKRMIISIALFGAIATISVAPVWGYELNSNTKYEYKPSKLIEKIDINQNDLYQINYTTARLNIRKNPSTDSEILDVLNWNESLNVFLIYKNSEWAKIKYDNGYAFVSKQYLSDQPCELITYIMPVTSGKKSFEPYSVNHKSIFSKNSKQYELQQMAYTGEYGIRQVNGRFCVAVGSSITTEIGQYFDLVLENGTVIPCVLGDGKADQDTCSKNIVTVSNGCLSEFIVDMDLLNKEAKKNGDISYCNDSWNSRVEKIIVYQKNVFD